MASDMALSLRRRRRKPEAILLAADGIGLALSLMWRKC
jgi:hypothetical protein